MLLPPKLKCPLFLIISCVVMSKIHLSPLTPPFLSSKGCIWNRVYPSKSGNKGYAWHITCINPSEAVAPQPLPKQIVPLALIPAAWTLALGSKACPTYPRFPGRACYVPVDARQAGTTDLVPSDGRVGGGLRWQQVSAILLIPADDAIYTSCFPAVGHTPRWAVGISSLHY